MNDELKELKNKAKNNINILISNGLFIEARKYLKEYKEIFKDDIEIYSIESILLILEGKMEEAKNIINEGLKKSCTNFDLIYNLGYLYEVKNEIKAAKIIYNIARIVNENNDYKEIINSKLNEIGYNRKKYNVILLGNYDRCMKFNELFDEWNVVKIINLEILYNNEYILNLENYKYDFIFVVEDIDKNKILKSIKKYNKKNIYFFEDYKLSVIEGLDYKILDMLRRNKINGIITGLSYAEVGIKEDINDNFINFSFSSQDLYYDFKLIKYLFNFKQVKDNLKYVIINMGYYSFDYDMTKTNARNRIHRYINYFEDYHNNESLMELDIIRSFYEKGITFKEYIDMNKLKEETILTLNDSKGIYEAQKNSSMDYEVTRKENEKILEEYIVFLKENSIVPIIAICPTSKYYRDNFNINKRNIFYNILDRLKYKYNFQVVDYFDSDLFEDDDFWDYSHLNGKGAEKFTKILKEEIQW
ncbi:tetratricopeptide repeat protein [Clostridium tertium]|uniref:tetratricopeptide repeat protein n=1 Tax=Clostridium tertium TaxID=1559 RepID=UPI001C1E2222|nr:hypothetical protein [Clostridium tertium]MBU6135920.1 hypothetical protein [Clostridium tertium]